MKKSFVFFMVCIQLLNCFCSPECAKTLVYEGWNFNSGNYLFTTDTK